MKSAAVFLTLGPEFYDRVQAAHFPKAILRWWNAEAARILEMEHLTQIEIQNHFWFFKSFRNNIPYPLALRYHGHQFRHYNPNLGDGRGFLLAQFLGRDRKLYDLSTKGSGTTPYSRGGDGRLTLKGAIRELLATEMLESLGVNTSQTLCIFETGETLHRSDEPDPARGAVLTRKVHSSIRFGTFQRLAYYDLQDEIRKLTGHCLDHYYPEIKVVSGQSEGALFFRAVMRRTAKLAAQILIAGFVHGVLNTDNMSITGELFDFGPFRFLSHYNPFFTAAYFDEAGLYSFGRQPESFYWGLKQLGESLKVGYPEISPETILLDYPSEFQQQLVTTFLARLNLTPQFDESDQNLLQSYFQMLESGDYLFEQTFYDFYSGQQRQWWRSSVQKPLYQTPQAQKFLEILSQYKVAHDKWVLHPYFQNQEPETVLIHDIEALWQKLTLVDDWQALQFKIARIREFRGAFAG